MSTISRSKKDQMISKALARTHWKMSANFASHHPEWTPDDMHSVGSITPRYATLERKGLIIRDGTTRKGKKGRSQLVMYYKK